MPNGKTDSNDVLFQSNNVALPPIRCWTGHWRPARWWCRSFPDAAGAPRGLMEIERSRRQCALWSDVTVKSVRECQ